MEFRMKWLLYVALSVLAGFLLLFLVRILGAVFQVLAELFVFTRMFRGGQTHRSTKRHLRLYTYTCETQYLDEVAIEELYNFLVGSVLQTNFDTKEKTMEAMHKVILSYSHISLFRDKIDGTLRGMAMIGTVHHKDYTTIKMGLTFLKTYYKGTPFSYLAMLYFIICELILHPFTPLYIVGKAYGHKSYLVAMGFKESYPRYNKETPEHFKKILLDYANSVLSEGDTYDERTSVLKQERTLLKDNLLAVSEQDLQNPHIKYFVETNPNYVKGHCLVCAWRMDWRDLGTILFDKILKNSLRSRSHKDGPRRESQFPGLKTKRKPKLLRRITFQDESANAYAVNLYQTDIGGDAVLSPTNEFTFNIGSPTSPNKSFSDPDIPNI